MDSFVDDGIVLSEFLWKLCFVQASLVLGNQMEIALLVYVLVPCVPSFEYLAIFLCNVFWCVVETL